MSVEIHKTFLGFTQKADDLDANNTEQFLLIETEDAGSGKYLVLSTERWAIDTDKIQEELIDPINKVLEQIGAKTISINQ